MQTIWKYKLEVTDEQSIDMPAGAQILSAGVQDGAPCIWVRVDPDQRKYSRNIYIVGTGFACPDGPVFVGTFALFGGKFIGHVFADPA